MTDSLFAGLKVIDCASWIAAPAAATILSDFGANVIKIEPPGAGDPWRASTPMPGKIADYYWQLTSRNKRSLAIDLKHAEGLAVLYRLLATADVFVTNFPLPVRDRLNIAPAHLLPLNPRLIYASFTAYGEAGDEAAKTGFDSTAYWARTGLMDMVRATPETEPARSAPGMGDHPSATGLYAAIVTALYRREKTGKGQHIDMALLDTQVAMLANLGANYLVTVRGFSLKAKNLRRRPDLSMAIVDGRQQVVVVRAQEGLERRGAGSVRADVEHDPVGHRRSVGGPLRCSGAPACCDGADGGAPPEPLDVAGRRPGRLSLPSCSVASRPSLRWPLKERPALTATARVGVGIGRPGRRKGLRKGPNQGSSLRQVKRSGGSERARVPFPIPARCRAFGNGNWELGGDQRSARR